MSPAKKLWSDISRFFAGHCPMFLENIKVFLIASKLPDVNFFNIGKNR